jgi:hypothetical protein
MPDGKLRSIFGFPPDEATEACLDAEAEDEQTAMLPRTGIRQDAALHH